MLKYTLISPFTLEGITIGNLEKLAVFVLFLPARSVKL